MGRIASDRSEKGEFIYVPGIEKVWRIAVEPDELKLDETWCPRYRRIGGSQGLSWDGCLSEDYLWLMDNGDIDSLRAIYGNHPNGRFKAEDPEVLSRLSWQRAAPWIGQQRLLRVSLRDGSLKEISPFGAAGGGILSRIKKMGFKTAAKKAAETSAPFVIDAVQKGASQAGPLLQAGASKVGPAVQGMVQSEAFKQATSGVQPLVREGAETIDKVVNDPTVKSAISAAETSITETAKAAQPYLPVAAKGAASAGKAVAGALSWSADMVNTLSTKGGEAAGQQLMDTLKSGAQNGAKFTQEVVVPVTKDVVLPAAKKSLNFAVETSGKAMGEAKKAALETPNGQAMSEKVTGISAQVTGAVQGVTKQAASTADQVTGKISGVGRTVDQAVNAAAGTADQVLDKAGDALQGAATKVVDKADQVTDKAADVIDRAVDAAAGTTDQVRDAAADIAGKKPN